MSTTMTMLELPPAFRFHPTYHELITYYLRHRVSMGTKFRPYYFAECPEIYGKATEPWEIWDRYGGPQLEEGEPLHFFTERVKRNKNGCRFDRSVGSGAWSENYPRKILSPDGYEVGKKREFRYEGGKYLNQNEAWMLQEFEVNSQDLLVVCTLRKNKKKEEQTIAEGMNAAEGRQTITVNADQSNNVGAKKVKMRNIRKLVDVSVGQNVNIAGDKNRKRKNNRNLVDDSVDEDRIQKLQLVSYEVKEEVQLKVVSCNHLVYQENYVRSSYVPELWSQHSFDDNVVVEKNNAGSCYAPELWSQYKFDDNVGVNQKNNGDCYVPELCPSSDVTGFSSDSQRSVETWFKPKFDDNVGVNQENNGDWYVRESCPQPKEGFLSSNVGGFSSDSQSSLDTWSKPNFGDAVEGYNRAAQADFDDMIDFGDWIDYPDGYVCLESTEVEEDQVCEGDRCNKSETGPDSDHSVFSQSNEYNSSNFKLGELCSNKNKYAAIDCQA